MPAVPQWRDYLTRVYQACLSNYENLFIGDGALYGGKEGHKRLAREIGPALRDFSEADSREILQTSYSFLYVRLCDLRPILDAKEWINEMQKGMNHYF